MRHRKQHIYVNLLALLLVISQAVNSPAYPDIKALNKVQRDLLAPPSLFSSSHIDERSDEFKNAFISRVEFLNIAFSLYVSLVIDELSLDRVIAEIRKFYEESAASFEHLRRCNFNGIRIDRKRGVLYIPYDDLEIRIYNNALNLRGLALESDQFLLEQGSGSLYNIEVVTPASTGAIAALSLIEYDKRLVAGITDELAGLCGRPAAEEYRRLAEKQRDDINEESTYRETLEERVIPKLTARREELLSSGKKAVLTVGVTGSAAFGKTSVARQLKDKLIKTFKNVNMILFDDWLLQASDRSIDPMTGKTTEDMFKKFEVYKFVRSLKAFMKGDDLLKPIYDQTAKGNVKLGLDGEGRPVVIFGPKRRIVIVDTPEGVTLSCQDENGKVMESGERLSIFDVTFGLEEPGGKDSRGELVLNVFDTRIRIGALDEKLERAVQIVDAKGRPVANMVDRDTGELLADSGAILTQGGYIDTRGEFVDKPWKAREYIPYEDGVFIVEGLLSLFDYPDQPAGESLPELYTASLFIDADFGIRLDRGFRREQARAEQLKGRPMPEEESRKYIDVFTKRKEILEDPYIYATRGNAEFLCTTKNRTEGLFSLYRNGRLSSERLMPVIERIGLNAKELNDELDRIELDFILDRLRRSTVNGELQFTRKIEGEKYDVYFLGDHIVIKVPKAKRDSLDACLKILRSRAGDVAAPCMLADLSSLGIKIEGVPARRILVQNEISPLSGLLTDPAKEEDARGYLTRFIELQKKMWGLRIIDAAPHFDRYGYMMTDQGRPTVLLYAIDNISAGSEDFNPDKLRALADGLSPGLRGHYKKGLDDLLAFMTKKNFGSGIGEARILPNLFHPQISSEQLDYIASLVMDYKAQTLWELFKTIKLPSGVTPEIVWTRLWLYNVTAEYTPEVREAIGAFYDRLLADPSILQRVKLPELRNLILGTSPPLSRQDLTQINKFISYLWRIPLKMIMVGETHQEVQSALKIKKEFYDAMDRGDKEDLIYLLAHPDELAQMLEKYGDRIDIPYIDTSAETGRTTYLRLRKPVDINGKRITLLRIKGGRPLKKPGTNELRSYSSTWATYKGRVMESYASGAVLTRHSQPEPHGTMRYSDSLTEYGLMETFSGSGCDTDTAIGIGRYRDLKFKNRPVGYVICGVEGPDYRLDFEGGGLDKKSAGNLIARDIVSERIIDMSGRLSAFYEEFGRAIRYLHDNGYSHRHLQIRNIGIGFDAGGAARVILRDFDRAQNISGNPQSERVADRFLDVSRVLYDLLFQRMYYYSGDDGKVKIESKSLPGLVVNFLKGYFYELNETRPEFGGLAAFSADFIDRTRSIIDGTRDYEELNETNPYFGKLAALLRAADENASRDSLSGAQVIIFDWDGTIADTAQIWIDIWKDVYFYLINGRWPSTQGRHEVEEQLSDFFNKSGGRGIEENVRELIEIAENNGLNEEAASNIYNKLETYAHGKLTPKPEIFPFVRVVLQLAKSEGVAIYVVSGSGQKILKDSIENAGLGELIPEGHIFSTTRSTFNNKRDYINSIWETEGVPKDRVVMVGDSPSDRVSAEEAGVTFVDILELKPETPRASSAGWPIWEDTPIEKRVLVMVSGGDCAGLNPFMGYLAKELKSFGMAVAGVKNGLEGLVKSDPGSSIIPIGPAMASMMPYLSSVEFGSTRKSLKEGTPDIETAISNIISAAGNIVVVGGNDHLNEAVKLSSLLSGRNITVIGVPKTIDNDVLNTTALGVVSSASTVLEETYRAAALPGSGECVIVEVMGRNMGDLAVSAGNRYPENFDRLPGPLRKKIESARPAVMTLVPEYPISVDGILAQARERMRRYGALTVVAAEGFKLSKEDRKFPSLIDNNPILAAILKDIKEDDHHNIIIPQGIAAEFMAEILKEFKPVIEVLGFTPRGTIPTERERRLAEAFAKLAREAIVARMTGYGAASSDIKDDRYKGVLRLVPLSAIAGKTPEGKSLAKTLGQIYTEDRLVRAGVILEPDQSPGELEIVPASSLPKAKSRMAVARAALSTFKSAWAHNRPSIIYINGADADRVVGNLHQILAGIEERGLEHDYLLTKDSVIPLTGDRDMSLSALVNTAYGINTENKYVNIALSGKFRISRRDPLLPALCAVSEELAVRLKAAGDRSGDSEYYIFDDNLKELAQVVKLVLLNAKPPMEGQKKMSDVRLTAMDLSLNALPGESDAFTRPVEPDMQSIHAIDQALPLYEQRGRVICHIIDSGLIPEGQAALITPINKLGRSDDMREKVIIGNRGESIEETIMKVLERHPDAIIDAAVTDQAKQEELTRKNILSLVFQMEEGPCNFRQLEGIIASLRALQRNDKESLLKLYELLTGSPFNEPVPEDLMEFIKRLVFRLPAIEIKDFDELKRLNDNLLKLIQAA